MANSSGIDEVTDDASRIPAVLRIGVTGHRKLDNPALVRDRVRQVLDELDQLLKSRLRHSPHTFTAVSSLAEGSDRLVAREVLARGGAASGSPPFLEVVLPMPEGEYSKDFLTAESKQEFGDLLGRARLIKVVGRASSREAAFEKAGMYVVNGSDVLIAIWNGQEAAGPGGTGDIVAFARKAEHPLIWIDSRSGEVHYEWSPGKLLAPLLQLDRYNGKPLGREKISGFSRRLNESFLAALRRSGLPEGVLQPIGRDLLPKYARASLLAKRYQRYYFAAGMAIYVLAVLAVATVATEELFIGDIHRLILGPGTTSREHLELAFKGLEFAYMLVILLMVIVTNRYGFHRQWIDYRFLTERIRAAIFFTIAGIRYEPLRYSSYLDRSMQSDYWIVKAYSSVWQATPRSQPIADLRELKGFLRAAWIGDQIAFYESHGRRQQRLNDGLELVSFGLFIVTLAAAAIPLVLYFLRQPAPPDQPYMRLIGILFPAAGAAIAGYLATRELRRNAERYSQMVAPMRNIYQQIEMAHDRADLIDVIEEANELILGENQDWRVNLLSQKLKP